MGCNCKQAAKLSNSIGESLPRNGKEKTLKFLQTTAAKIFVVVLAVIMLPIILLMLLYTIVFKDGALHITIPKKWIRGALKE